jgi:hypothetical protein
VSIVISSVLCNLESELRGASDNSGKYTDDCGAKCEKL